MKKEKQLLLFLILVISLSLVESRRRKYKRRVTLWKKYKKANKKYKLFKRKSIRYYRKMMRAQRNGNQEKFEKYQRKYLKYQEKAHYYKVLKNYYFQKYKMRMFRQKAHAYLHYSRLMKRRGNQIDSARYLEMHYIRHKHALRHEVLMSGWLSQLRQLKLRRRINYAGEDNMEERINNLQSKLYQN